MGIMTDIYCLDDAKPRAIAGSPKGRVPPPYEGHWTDRVVAAEIADHREVCENVAHHRIVAHSIVLTTDIQAVTITVHLGDRDLVACFANASRENVVFPNGGYRLAEGAAIQWSTNVAGNAAISVFGDREPIATP